MVNDLFVCLDGNDMMSTIIAGDSSRLCEVRMLFEFVVCMFISLSLSLSLPPPLSLSQVFYPACTPTVPDATLNGWTTPKETAALQ